MQLLILFLAVAGVFAFTAIVLGLFRPMTVIAVYAAVGIASFALIGVLDPVLALMGIVVVFGAKASTDAPVKGSGRSAAR